MDNRTTTTSVRTTRVVRVPEVMVSYSSHDRERVMQFVRALRAAGVAVWIDQGGIDGAQRWSEEIVNAIEACRTVLLFMSRASMESQNIAKEVALAWESGKHFLPAALEEAKIPKSMQYQLAGIQYVKLYEGEPDAKFESLLRALVRLGVRVSPYSMAVVSAGIGDRDQALEWLEKACEERSGGLSRLKTEPRFNPLRSDPRFAELAKRADSISLESEDATAEIVLPQPLTPAVSRSVPTGPVPTWKRLLWPDIFDDKSARAAAALGVWASAAITVASWTLSFLVSTPTVTTQGWWNDPIVLTLIFGAIGFGVQKMGRPAAIIGTGLCALGALGNLQLVQTMRNLMAMQEMYRNNADQSQLSGIYYSAWFGLLAGIAFVIAFVNAARGTLAYRQMVAARQTKDKQDALNAQDLLAVRRKATSLVQRIWGSRPLAGPNLSNVKAETGGSGPAAAGAISTAELPPPPILAPISARAAFSDRATSANEGTISLAAPASIRTNDDSLTAQSLASPESISLTSSAGPASVDAASLDQFPQFDDAPGVHTLGELIGSNPFRPVRTLAYLAANIAAGLAFMLSRSVLLSGPLHPVYWQFALLHGIALTLAAFVAFRFVRSGWTATLIAAFGTVALILPVYHFTLGTFNIADLFYREQFQEFLLIPFVDALVTLLGLFFLVPRIRPLALGIWVGSVCAEVATSMLITTLRDLGSGTPPDPILSGVLVFFVGVRSLVFAAVFWAVLKFTGVGRVAGKNLKP